MFVVRTSKPVENIWNNGLIALTIALRFRYTFCIPQIKRLRARKIGLQYKIRKGRKLIWDRFSNPWNSNGIRLNCLILLTWSRIVMYLPNTVGKRHKKAFKFSATEINGFKRELSFGVHRNTWWQKWRGKVNVRKIGSNFKMPQVRKHQRFLLQLFDCWRVQQMSSL